MSLATELLQLVNRPSAASYMAGKTPPNPSEAYSVIYPGPGTPERRYLDGRALDRHAVARVMVVSNNSDGAATFAAIVIDLIDGHRLDDRTLLTVEAVGPVLEDTTDPSAWRWTVTVEVHHHT